MLYAAYRRKEAQGYLDWVRENYQRTGGEWDQKNVEDFVLYELRRELSRPSEVSRDFAGKQVGVSMIVAFVALARGDEETGRNSFAYARKVHAIYHKGRTSPRLRLASLDNYAVEVVLRLLVAPRAMGYNLDIAERSRLYRGLDPKVQKIIQEQVGRHLKTQCEQEGIDFQSAFPPPATTQPPAGGQKSSPPGAGQAP